MRSVASDTLAVNGMQHYAAYGDPFGAQGSLGTPFGFTGEQTDGNGLVYLRARHYAPSVGIFPSLDPFEGIPGRPMSLNGYTYVEGNVVNATDANGMSRELAQLMSSGGCSDAEDCRNKCKDTVNPLTCTLVCLDEQREIQEQNIKNATVMIGLGDAEDQATCQSGRWIVSPNLGTITSRGIITHDHVAGAGAFFGRTAHDTNEAVTFFKSWPCVHFTGRSGTISLPGWAIRIEGGQSVQGTLLISPYQSYGILGHPSGSKTFSYDLRSVGNSITEDFQWAGTSSFPSNLLVAYVRAPNDNPTADPKNRFDAFFNHSLIGVMQHEVDYNRPLGPTIIEGQHAMHTLLSSDVSQSLRTA